MELQVGCLPMDKPAHSGLFVNDGSFMERFKHLQGEKAKEVYKAKNVGESKSILGASNPYLAYNKIPISIKTNGSPIAIHSFWRQTGVQLETGVKACGDSD